MNNSVHKLASVKKLAALGAINVGLLFALPGSSPGAGPQPSALPPTYATPATKILAPSGKAAGPKTEIQAEILPSATYAVGKSLSGGPDGKNYGIGLTANDISNSWTTCISTCTLDFVFFIFTNQDQTAAVQFKVLSPSGSTVYQYAWTSHLVPTNWYSVSAKGNYRTAGTYFAEVFVAAKLEGWAPIVFTKSS